MGAGQRRKPQKWERRGSREEKRDVEIWSERAKGALSEAMVFSAETQADYVSRECVCVRAG